MSVQEEFLKDLNEVEEADILTQPLEPETQESDTEPENEGTEESTEMKLKNRRERRLAEKLQKERESNIALNARIQVLDEARSIRENTSEAEYLKSVERIYGDATPEAKEATELLKKAIRDSHESAIKEAEERALARFEETRNKEAAEMAQEEDALDEMMENLEDESGADFSDPTTRKGFLRLMERLSPKDEEGNIIEYADASTVYELFQSQREKSSRAKELASRSMVRSGASQGSKLQDDSVSRFLKENGII